MPHLRIVCIDPLLGHQHGGRIIVRADLEAVVDPFGQGGAAGQPSAAAAARPDKRISIPRCIKRSAVERLSLAILLSARDASEASSGDKPYRMA